jgi:RNA polymerase sigma-70 factor (ECF subfamily)
MDQTDEQLLSLLATDLDYHFRQLVALYQQRLYSFALRLVGRPQDAEDIVQETFLRTYHALKGYPATKVRALHLRGWLYTITLNIFRNRQRKPEHQSIPLDISEDSPLLEIEDTSFGPDEEAYWREWRHELEMHLATLPERYRVAVTLYYFEDLSYVEIAELLNQPVGTVKAHIHRALRMLYKALGTEANEVR